PVHGRGDPSARTDPDSVRETDGGRESRRDRASREGGRGRRALLRAGRDVLTVQAVGGGSPDLRPLEGARARRAAAVTDEPVRIPIEDALDLHAFAPRDVASV